MRRAVLLALLVLASACPKKAPVEPSPALERPLKLWRLEKSGKVSYLLGTCHVPMPLDHAVPQPHRERLQQARQVFVEARREDVRVVRAPQWMERSARDTLGLESWLRMTRVLRHVDAAPLLDHTPAWLLAGLWEPRDSPEGMVVSEGFYGKGLDGKVEEYALFHGIPVDSLDDVEWVRKRLLDMDQAILEAMADPVWPEKGSLSTAGANVESCIGIAEDLRPSLLPELAAFQIEERNEHWLRVLRPELAQGGVFAAVGSAHTPGLIATLEGEGYTVERLYGPPSDLDVRAIERERVAVIARDPQLPADWRGGLVENLMQPSCADRPEKCGFENEHACRTAFRHAAEDCAMAWAPDLVPAHDPNAGAVLMVLLQCVETSLANESRHLAEQRGDEACMQAVQEIFRR